MIRISHNLFRFALAAGVGIGCLFASEKVTLNKIGSVVTQADARIGRPLTPLSYAGVARRTTRRAVYGGAAVAGAAAIAAPVYAPGCVQAVDAYGQVYHRCP